MTIKSSYLHPEEELTGEEGVVINGRFKGYTSLYPLPIIIALFFRRKL